MKHLNYLILSMLCLIPFMIKPDYCVIDIAGWGAMVYENYTETICGEVFTSFPPPNGNYFQGYILNYPVIILQFLIMALFIILRRQNK